MNSRNLFYVRYLQLRTLNVRNKELFALFVFEKELFRYYPKTEEKILSTLNKEITKKTAIIVSHRISSIKNADHIIVLEEGRIIQAGTHQQLISIKGYYKELFQKQLLEFNKENTRDQDWST